MNIKHYQTAVSRTMDASLTRQQAVANYALGLAGEAGEVIEPIKKHLFHARSLDLTDMAEEICDVIWYCAALANTLGIDLGEALEQNVQKLQKRYPNGFSTERRG